MQHLPDPPLISPSTLTEILFHPLSPPLPLSSPLPSTIPKAPSNLSYDGFFRDYMYKNCPVIFDATLTQNWPARVNWVNERHEINLQFLRTKLGNSHVCVSVCEEGQYGEQKKIEMSGNEYFDCWKILTPGKGQYYMKDFHYVKEFPNDIAYVLPLYFSDDWLNEWYDAKTDVQDDYRFFYMGPKDSWTPIHADVFRSFSWSTNVIGRKKWIFYPPHLEHKVKGKTRPNEIDDKGIECYQETGETIFVPSGWYHFVYNLEDTISINHNWLNGCNIDKFWEHLKSELELVIQELLQWDKDMAKNEDFDEQCQTLLRANSGINFSGFWEFLMFILKENVKKVQEYLDTPNSTIPTAAVFNLHKITHLALECMPQHPKMKLEMDKDRDGLDLVHVSIKLLDNIKRELI